MLIIKWAVAGYHILHLVQRPTIEVVLKNIILIALLFPTVSFRGYCIIDFEYYYVDEVMKPAMLMTSQTTWLLWLSG